MEGREGLRKRAMGVQSMSHTKNRKTQAIKRKSETSLI